MTESLRSEILDLLDESTAGLTLRQFLRAVPAATTGQLMDALAHLEETGLIGMDIEGLYTRRRRRPIKVKHGHSSYLDQKTRPGGVLTAEGHIPYFRHPSGWDLPVKVDEHGRPVRKNRRLVFMLPGGGEYQPEDEQSIARKLEGRE